MQQIHTQQDKIHNESGQALIEFVLVFSFGIGIMFLFLYLALNFTSGYYAHYATFMASRTFLVHDNSSNRVQSVISGAELAARKVIDRYQLGSFDINGEVNILNPLSSSSAFSGVTYKYEKLLSPYRPIGGSDKAVFFSEAFLGKEPPRIECLNRICQMIMGPQGCGSSQNLDITAFDNGC